MAVRRDAAALVLRLLSAVFAAHALLAAPAFAEPFRTAHVETEFVSSRDAVAPGETFTIALRQSIAPHWHTYWRNPGDSGEPTQILKWRLPAGYEAGPLQWPAPEPLPFDILVNYGYGGEVLFPITLQVPATARVGETAEISADVYWLACDRECVPEQGALDLSLPIAAQGRDDPHWAPRIAAALRDLPQRADFAARVTGGTPAKLTVAIDGAAQVRRAHFFPYDSAAIDHAAPENPSVGAKGLSFDLKAGAENNLGRAPLEGVLEFETRGADGAWAQRAYEISAAPGAALPETSGTAITGQIGASAPSETARAAPQAKQGDLGLPLAIVFAFLGGLILNIMPCVLPVLSIKALSLAGSAHSGEARRHGVLYMAGVMATFLTLAGLIISLRGAGDAVGWGFQLQQPWVMALLALLFFAIGLNLVGAFHVGGGMQNVGEELASRRGEAGAFFTGALAVVAATPCTAPFMAGAAGFALTQSPLSTLFVFGALGLGFAAPITGLSFTPALRKLIPKPGAWMEKFRNVLAFPMFGAAVWLSWVLFEEAGASGALALLSVAVALAFALTVAKWGRAWIAAGLIALAIVGAASWRPLVGIQAPSHYAIEAWAPARLAELRAEGRPVFVNFTAAWCVSCKVNERVALASPRVISAFARHRIAYLKGDWTVPNDEIAATLQSFGRAGVPLYLYYAPGAAEPVVLPQFLTETLMLNTIGGGEP